MGGGGGQEEEKPYHWQKDEGRAENCIFNDLASVQLCPSNGIPMPFQWHSNAIPMAQQSVKQEGADQLCGVTGANGPTLALLRAYKPILKRNI